MAYDNIKGSNYYHLFGNNKMIAELDIEYLVSQLFFKNVHWEYINLSIVRSF